MSGTPHVLRHFCASRLYLAGMSLFAIRERLGHAWTGTTGRYIHVHATHAALAGLPTGGRVRFTEVRARIPRAAPILRIAEVLTDLDLLDDTTPRAGPGSTATLTNCRPASSRWSGPGRWCCLTATAGPDPARPAASTSTASSSGRPLSAGPPTMAIYGRSSQLTSRPRRRRCRAQPATRRADPPSAAGLA